MPRTLPRLLTPFRVQRPDLLPADVAAVADASALAPLAAPLTASGGLADTALGTLAPPACRGDSPLPPCGRVACPSAGCAGSAA